MRKVFLALLVIRANNSNNVTPASGAGAGAGALAWDSRGTKGVPRKGV